MMADSLVCSAQPINHLASMDEFATLSSFQLAMIEAGDETGHIPFDEDHPQGGYLSGFCVVA